MTEVIWGEAGSGKTRMAVENNPNHYMLSVPQAGNLWWDGYEGEDVLIIDDFYGGIQYALLLRILDGYQLRIPIKGGFTYALWTKIIITSNKDPREWYQRGYTKALARRINKISHIQDAIEWKKV